MLGRTWLAVVAALACVAPTTAPTPPSAPLPTCTEDVPTPTSHDVLWLRGETCGVPELPSTPWPMLQGNARHDGNNDDGRGEPMALRRAWQADIGAIVGHPVVADGRVYAYQVISSADTGIVRRLVALDAVTGETVLVAPVPLSNEFRQDHHVGLAYEAGRLFLVESDQATVRGFDATTGAVAWTTDIGVNLGPDALTVADGVVYATGTEDHLHAIDAATGAVRWSAPVRAQGTVAVGDGDVFTIGACTRARLEAADGALIWERHDGCTGGYSGLLTFHDGRLFESRSVNLNHVFDAADGAPLYEYQHLPRPVIADGRLILQRGAPGNIDAVDPATGELLWRTTLDWRDGELIAIPVVGNGVLYVVTDGAILYALDVASGRILFRDEVLPPPALGPEATDPPVLRLGPRAHDSASGTGMAVGNGVLVVPTEEGLVGYRSAGPSAP